MKELIAIPLIIVISLLSLWFGVRTINHHFDSQERVTAERIQSEREALRDLRWRCVKEKDAATVCR